jgi:hypothetical protein
MQKLIDEYFIFRANMRGSRVAKLSDLIHYVREANGYYFTPQVLSSLLRINPHLYTLITIHYEKYVKCSKLSADSVERRQFRTQLNMRKKPMN